ncbi:MAG: hypothetical protein MJZ86_10460 [Bacteroidales bacterium]|nr:hypothetical protein [Bacteroidales bacterium]
MSDLELGNGLHFEAKGDINIGKVINVESGATYNEYSNQTDNSTHPTQTNTLVADPLSAEVLRPYIDAGMLDENLMPADELSRGETAVLAHDIAERLGLQRFWPIFEQRWGIKYLSSDYNHFTKTAKFVEFQRRLNKIK